jgi:hypothetical protein
MLQGSSRHAAGFDKAFVSCLPRGRQFIANCAGIAKGVDLAMCVCRIARAHNRGRCRYTKQKRQGGGGSFKEAMFVRT